MKIRPCANRGGSFFALVVFIVVDYIHHMVRKLLSLLKDAFQFVIVLKIYSRLDDISHQYWLYKRWDHYFVEPEWQLALVAELQLVPVRERQPSPLLQLLPELWQLLEQPFLERPFPQLLFGLFLRLNAFALLMLSALQ